ncbi:MAG: hypothetical protein ACOVSR_09300, partial [Bacteroidia bacterium]
MKVFYKAKNLPFSNFLTKQLMLYFLFFTTLGAFAQTDDFEASKLDTANWKYVGTVHTDSIISGGSASGSKHLKLNSLSGTSHSQYLYYNIAPKTLSYVSWYVKLDPSVPSGANGYFVIGDTGTSSNRMVFCLLARTGATSAAINFVGSGNLVIPYSLGSWAKIELRNINFLSQKFDIWVNDSLKGANASFRESFNTEVPRLKLYNLAQNSSSYYDGIIVRSDIVLTTKSAAVITSTSATLGVIVSNEGATSVLQRGVVYGTSINPTFANSKVLMGTGQGNVQAGVTGLTPATLYHMRGYAINNTDTAYGADSTFTTLASAPTVITNGVGLITSNSALLKGNVTASGGASVTERGIVYSTTANPIIGSSTKVAIGFNVGTYGNNITGLNSATLYHFRAYAINSVGTSYGADSTFTTLASASFTPTVLTTNATLITSTSATLAGNVTDSGSATVTERGVVFATTINPTTGNTKVQIGTGVGTFSQNVTGLTPSTLYHVRAYAINSAGTGYGADSTFTTAAGAPSTVLAGDTSLKSIPMGIPVVVDNTLTIAGASTIPGANVTIVSGLLGGDSLSYASTLPAGVTASYNAINGVLQFNGNATAAEYQTLLRSVTLKTNAVTSTAARRVSFTLGNAVPYNGHFYEFVSTPGSFTASKSAASARSYFGLQGYLVTIADSFENNYVYQKISADAWMGASDEFSEINAATGTTTYANQTAAEGNWYWVSGPEKGTKFANGNFPSTVQPGKYMNWSNFEPNNASAGGEHYVQFFSTEVGKWNDLANNSNIGYVCEYGGMPGDPTLVLSYARNITPVLINLATVITTSPTFVATTLATLGGNVTADGGASVTERGIVYSTSINPTTANTKVAMGTGLGAFSQMITGLSASTTYHVRAYAINIVGTSYGADSTFTTPSGISLPIVSTGTATAISNTSATLGGNVLTDGGTSLTERGVVFATTVNPTTANTKATIGSGLGNFSQNITALTPNTTYYYRAYAINSVGTSYGIDSVFTTLPNPEFNKNITNAFSPDGNGTNDTWVIDNADMLDGHEITVYNIFGQ